jgi:hypothetical protein
MNRYVISGLTLLFSVATLAQAQVVLPASTTPSSGVAGVNNVNLTASKVPGTPTPGNLIISFENTCGGAAVMTVSANSARAILGTDRINFNIPAGLRTGAYYVQVSDTADTPSFTSTDCSLVQVTGSSALLNACVAGSSLGVLLPSSGTTGNVTAYVPKGYWESSTTGIFVKNIEGTAAAGASIATANAANSCSSNPATGQTVCVANNTDVYLLTGTTLTNTLTSGSNGTTGFSGGSCYNCGVALNANNNTAVINMGVSGAPSGSGVQVLNLNTNTFGTPFPMTVEVSENISVDPTRSLILSADEDQSFALVQIQSDGVTLKEFDPTFFSGAEDDSSAEDCSTGIALAPGEFTNNVQLVNLNSISFGTTTYTAPNSVFTVATNYSFSAGLCGSAVAQGSGHLAVVTGEFGGNTFSVLQLPASASTATPAVVDYVTAAIPDNAACGGTFSAGYDPHTVTAYTSPNDGNSYAVFAGYIGGVPACLAKVNMTQLINSAVRGGSGYQAHDISTANFPASAVTFYTLP